MARRTQAEAREMARAAKRRRDEARHKRDQLVEEAATDFFAGQLLIEEGTEQVARSIAALIDDLDETVSSTADLLGISTKEVTRIRRTSQTSRTGDDAGRSDPGVNDEDARNRPEDGA